jgi:predicted RNase H-like nuclease (RuvC/YqgF family)
MYNRAAWSVGLGLHGNRQIPVTMDRIYDKTTGNELTRSEIRSFEETIDELKQELRNVNNENTAIRQRVIKAELIVNELERASESSHTKNPYPKTKTTSESLNKELDELCNFYKLKIKFPNEFFCPFTQDIMVNPVTTSGGHTYEWSEIAQWFKEGNNKDPKTGLKLNNNILYPNHALRSAIRNFVPTCELIITELHKNEVPNKTQGSIRMRSAPAEYGTRSRLVSKTRRQSKVKASSKSRASTTAKAIVTETAPSTSTYDPSFRQQLG